MLTVSYVMLSFAAPSCFKRFFCEMIIWLQRLGLKERKQSYMGKGVRMLCGNAPVKNRANRFFFQKAMQLAYFYLQW